MSIFTEESALALANTLKTIGDSAVFSYKDDEFPDENDVLCILNKTIRVDTENNVSIPSGAVEVIMPRSALERPPKVGDIIYFTVLSENYAVIGLTENGTELEYSMICRRL